MWPTKSELKGEDLTMEFLPPPPGRANYSSAEQFIEEIKETFREERELERQLPTVDGALRNFALVPWQLSMKGIK